MLVASTVKRKLYLWLYPPMPYWKITVIALAMYGLCIILDVSGDLMFGYNAWSPDSWYEYLNIFRANQEEQNIAHLFNVYLFVFLLTILMLIKKKPHMFMGKQRKRKV